MEYLLTFCGMILLGVLVLPTREQIARNDRANHPRFLADWRDFQKHNRGVSALEFGLLAGPLLMILLAGSEVLMLAATRATAQNLVVSACFRAAVMRQAGGDWQTHATDVYNAGRSSYLVPSAVTDTFTAVLDPAPAITCSTHVTFRSPISFWLTEPKSFTASAMD